MCTDFRLYSGLYTIARTIEFLSQDHDRRVAITVELNFNNQSLASVKEDIRPLMVRSRTPSDGKGTLIYGTHQKFA